jgi:PAS domain S-box-containing protein
VRIDTKKISNATVLTAIIVVLFMMLATHLILRQVYQEGIRETGIQQQNALKLFWELLRIKGSDFRIRGGNLLFGEYLVNGNNELPDKVREITGSNATIFMGDTRVATNILLKDGRRALGTKLTGPAYDAIYRKGKPFRGETLILGGTYSTAYDPIRDRSGNVIGVLFVGTQQSDYLAAYNRIHVKMLVINGTLACIFIFSAFLLLTERKRSGDAIQKQFEFLQLIIDAIPSPVFYKNAEGKYLGFNKIYESFVGLTREQMIGKTVHELWQKDLADRYRQMDQELLETSGVQVYESSVRYADGTLRDVIFNKAAFKNQDGTIGGLIGVILDITERKAAEEESRNAYRRIADILEFLPDATFVVDGEKRVIAWNRAIEVMTGVNKEEILGKGDHAYALPFYGVRRRLLIDLLDEDQEVQDRIYSSISRNGRTLCAEAMIRLTDGERYLWSAASPFYDTQGNQVGGIQTLRDVTDARQAVQERSRLEAQLHHSSMIKSLTIRLGHDLNTPLTPLFALLPMVRRKVRDPNLERMLDICQDCVGQIQGLTSKALDLVRFSSKSVPLELESVRLSCVAEHSANSFAALFSKRGITCINTVHPMLSVQGSEEQLALLFDNLLSNAARYAAENGVVRICAALKDATAIVSVQNDGIGLKPGHNILIFEEFFKADTARHDLSTQGLGLAICKSIVLNHKGRIWAESPGTELGTTISFTLQASETA